MTVESSQSPASQEKPKFFPLVPVVLKPEPEPEPEIIASGADNSAEVVSGNDLADEKFAPVFDVSPNLIEPTTASIYVESVPDANNMSHVLETGEILTTGAIDISKILTDTGEMVALEAQVDDEAIAKESQQASASAFSPMPATSASNFGSDLSIVPAKLNKGEGQLYVALTVSISLVAIGSLVLAGYMLNFF